MSSVSHVVYPLTWLMCPSYILGINKPASATGRHVPTVALIENFAAFPPALWLSVRLYAAAFPGLVCISGALSSIHGTAAGNSGEWFMGSSRRSHSHSPCPWLYSLIARLQRLMIGRQVESHETLVIPLLISHSSVSCFHWQSTVAFLAVFSD